MHPKNIESWRHDHTFRQDQEKAGEKRTLMVALVTAVMMVVEIIAGIIFGSMALFADGLHMASHALALSINVFAYMYARGHARDKSFSFGTGKVNALGGFTGAILLGIVALAMAWESLARFVRPVVISFDQAILVATLGLVINGVSVFILDSKQDHAHDHDDHPQHDQGHHHHDHNLRSAYTHVMADALTSVLAILALLAGKYFGLVWMDALMGIVGAVLVSRWSFGLLKTTSGVLLDKQGAASVQAELKKRIESDGDSRVTDLHLWAVGPNIYSAIISVVAHHPKEPEEYKKIISSELGLIHLTVEVHKYKE